MTVTDEHSSDIEEPDDLVLSDAAQESGPHSPAQVHEKLLALSTYFLISLGAITCTNEEAIASPFNLRLPYQESQSEKEESQRENDKALSLVLIASLTALYFKMKIDDEVTPSHSSIQRSNTRTMWRKSKRH